jgi:hypothetical protein
VVELSCEEHRHLFTFPRELLLLNPAIICMEILDGAREDTQTGQVVALLLQPMQENNQGFKFTKMTQILVVGLPNT